MKKALIIFVIGVAFIGVIIALMYVSTSNKEIGLRNQSVAQQKSNEAVFDNTWKIIQQQAQVSDQYKGAFKEIYPELMEGRYDNARGGALLSFIQESNPDFNTTLYEKLADSIEIQRTIFTREQRKLLDIKREHDNIRTKFPGVLFVGGRPELEITIVTSKKTMDVFSEGMEDDVNLF